MCNMGQAALATYVPCYSGIKQINLMPLTTLGEAPSIKHTPSLPTQTFVKAKGLIKCL